MRQNKVATTRRTPRQGEQTCQKNCILWSIFDDNKLQHISYISKLQLKFKRENLLCNTENKWNKKNSSYKTVFERCYLYEQTVNDDSVEMRKAG